MNFHSKKVISTSKFKLQVTNKLKIVNACKILLQIFVYYNLSCKSDHITNMIYCKYIGSQLQIFYLSEFFRSQLGDILQRKAINITFVVKEGVGYSIYCPYFVLISMIIECNLLLSLLTMIYLSLFLNRHVICLFSLHEL